MARHRWTLALIIICLPILATVITAFRVRDLPKNLQDSLKSEIRKQKCDDCDVNEPKVQKVHSVKTESAKRSYEELKKATREKQLELKQKASDPKTKFKFVDDSADDDDDDDFDFLTSVTGFILEEKSKKSNGVSQTKTGPPKSKPSESDEDDDGDDEDLPVITKNKKLDVKKKEEIETKKAKISNDKKIVKKLDKGEDEDSKDKSKGKDEKKKVDSKSSTKQSDTKGKKLVLDDDDDNDDDDDDIDSTEKTPKSKNNEHKVKTKDLKSKLDEEDDDDDDDDDDNLGKPKKAKASAVTKTTVPEKKIPKLDPKEKQSKDKDNGKDRTKTKDDLEKDKKASSHEHEKPVTRKTLIKETQNKSNEFSKPKAEVKKEEKKETRHKDESVKEPLKKQKEAEVIPKPQIVKKAIAPKEKVDKPKVQGKKDSSSEELLLDSSEISAHEDYIKEVSDALQRRNLLQSEFEDFYAFFPTFAPNFSRIHNPECRRHGQILLRQLRGTKLWALNMLDATAKIPSGMLQGNGIQLGDFDQCLGSRARVQLETGSVVKVQGQYCLVQLDVKAEHPELELPVHLALAKNLIKSRVDDPGHFVPRFSTLSWGVCVPAVCQPEDVEVVVKDALKHYQHTSGVVFRVKVDEQDCQTQGGDWWEDWLELPILLTLSFYGIILLLVLVATIQDSLSRRKSDEEQGENEEKTEAEGDEKAECDQKELAGEEKAVKKPADGFLSSFSLYRNIAKLIAPGTDDEIACIHGIRGLATLALLVAHKFLPVAVTPYTNRLRITEVVSSPLWSWSRAGWMYTDCFLLLSGTLTAHRMSADSDTGAPRRLFSRYLRLTPALLALVLFYAYIWDNISSGPMWGTLVTKNAEVCQEGWWWNLLYIQNYFGFEEMCAPQTHQLALDMQLTILGGILVWTIQSKQGISRVLLPSIHAVAAYSRYSTVREHRLTLLAYHGVTVSQLYRTARLSYTSSLHRSTSYLIGISLGLALRNPPEQNKILNVLGWITSSALWCLVWWAGFDSGSTTYRYNASFAAQYAALAPIASNLAIAWVIYAVHGKGSGYLYRLLCSRSLAFISRISYALYLCQFIVFLTNAATVKTSSEFTLMSLIDLQEISAILLSSVIMTLTFVIPMQSLHKVFSFSSKAPKEEAESKEDNESEEKGTKPETEEPDEKIPNNVEDKELHQVRRQHLLAHREVLEEIPEVEVEFELQRDKNDGLEEILEEEEGEEDGMEEEIENHLDDEDMEIIEEEQGGEDGNEDFWADRQEYQPRRTLQRDDDQDTEEWEWTANGRGAQYRYSR